MRITLYAKTCEFAGASLLAAALEKLSSGVVALVYHFPEPYRFQDKFPKAIRVTSNPSRSMKYIKRADWILLMGAPAVRSFVDQLPKHAAWKGQGLPPVCQLLKEKRIACYWKSVAHGGKSCSQGLPAYL